MLVEKCFLMKSTFYNSTNIEMDKIFYKKELKKDDIVLNQFLEALNSIF